MIDKISREVHVLVSMRGSVNMVADGYAQRQRPSESVSRRERPDRRRSYQRGQRAVSCDDNKDRTLTELELVRGDRSCDLRGDEVAEDMILLTCCFNMSVPELPAEWFAFCATLPRVPFDA